MARPNRAGGQIKYSFELSLAQRLDRQEQHRDSFADAGGRGEKQLAALDQHVIGGHGQFTLPRTILGEGKCQRNNGRIAGDATVMAFAQPVQSD